MPTEDATASPARLSPEERRSLIGQHIRLAGIRLDDANEKGAAFNLLVAAEHLLTRQPQVAAAVRALADYACASLDEDETAQRFDVIEDALFKLRREEGIEE